MYILLRNTNYNLPKYTSENGNTVFDLTSKLQFIKLNYMIIKLR